MVHVRQARVSVRVPAAVEPRHRTVRAVDLLQRRRRFRAVCRTARRSLAPRGLPFVMIDANAPIPGLVGRYCGGNMPKYFKGPQRPRLGDLAYTENAVMGV